MNSPRKLIFPVEGLSTSPDELTLNLGESFTIDATISPSGASDSSIIWSTSDAAIATVSNSGSVTTLKTGVATITATSVDGGFSSATEITVEENTNTTAIAVTGIDTTPSTMELEEGETFDIVATIAPDNAANQAVTWNSSDTQVAVVDSNGRVTAVSSGNAVIRAITEDGDFESSTIVTVPQEQLEITVPVSFVRTNSNVRTVDFGSPFTIIATVFPSNATNKTVIWESSDTSVASVDNNGVVTPLKPGRVKILVTTVDGGKQSDASITIRDNGSVAKEGRNLIITPNPASLGSRINLSGMPTGQYTVQVFAFDGSIVASEPADVTNSHFIKSRIPNPGTYAIRVTGKNGTYTGTLIIR